MFCTACGTRRQQDDALFCAQCGAGFAAGTNPAAQHRSTAGTLPDGIAGWSWGAFLLNWIWAIGNRTWIGLLALIPYAGLGVAIWLGIKGREMAWASKPWESVEHFNRVQKKWSQWGIGLAIFWVVIGVLITTLLFDYLRDAKNSQSDEVAEEVASVTACTLDTQLAALETASSSTEPAEMCTSESDE